MNTGQMLITIGAIFLLSLVILRVTTTLLTTSDVLDRSKLDILATSLATSIIEEANDKAFDANTVAGAAGSTAILSSTLGKEAGENYPFFNDFDDYNCYKDTPKHDTIYLASGDSVIFDTFCNVNYVLDTEPDKPVAQKTWHKLLSVKVTSDALMDENTNKQDTIKMSTVFSYWAF